MQTFYTCQLLPWLANSLGALNPCGTLLWETQPHQQQKQLSMVEGK